MQQEMRARLRTDAATVAIHWIVAASLLVSLGTGLRIAAADAEHTSFTRLLDPLFMVGDVSNLHVVSATLLLFASLAYVVYLRRAELTTRLSISLAALLAPERITRWYAINRVLYWAAFALILVAGVTGALLYFAFGRIPTRSLLAVHEYAAWALIAYVAIHVVAQVALGGAKQLLKIVSPRVAYGSAALFAASAAAAGVAAVALPAGLATVQPLKMPGIWGEVSIDGDPGDEIWASAPQVTLHTSQGANLPEGQVAVRVRGLHNGDKAFFLFEWQDATRSQKHLPLVKTEAGWKVMEKKYGLQDEDDYYEDKFAVMLAKTSRIGGGATQLGGKPLTDRPGGPSGRGLHYTTDGTIVDVWHWKSVRTGALGQIDDNYFGPPLAKPEKAGARYTGGYTQDPSEGGGFEQNWSKLEGKLVRPRRLPADLVALQARMGRLNLDPQAGDEGEWWMAKAETVAYSGARDDLIPVGTVIPSVLIDRPFTGDRGDVRAAATWKDGWWRLEVERKLDTRSKYDLPIATGTHLWVAVFDHTQARHSRHLHPLRIQVQ